MKHRTALLGLLVFCAACDSHSGRPATSPSAPSATVGAPTGPSEIAREIAVGQEVRGTLDVHGTRDVFELTAPSDGTLVVRLSWPSTQGRLELWLDDALSSQAPNPPVVGQVTIVAGRKYRVTVADSAAWDYDTFSLPYVFTTAIQ
jgi:hypothetical protein